MTTNFDTSDWTVPDHWTTIETVDAHTGGEPLRIIVDGFPELKGDSILEKRRYLESELDDFRKALMWEPRGHADMYGALLTEPDDDEADLGVLFMHNEGYSTMCGHGIIALTKVIVEAGVVSATDDDPDIKIETPAGIVVAKPKIQNETVQTVEFKNVPSFVYTRNLVVDVPGTGSVECTIAFGGAFYAYCSASEVDIDLKSENYRELIDTGREVKEAVSDTIDIEHPYEPDLSFLYGTIITDTSAREQIDSQNVCIFADGEVDRCPTGTGVSGRVAIRAAEGEMRPGEEFTVESIVGSKFIGQYKEELDYGGFNAVEPTVTGSAYVTGKQTFVFDPDDPFRNGFLLR